ncbi:cytochrome P450 71D11-like [Coffea eugenioides]|uniref:cytochrome P450 71D11-like n=1 Tax=Coffea eugenioides TaxID=49369 RepID=UPI000F60C6ED|nr:cytochrome P450 71D11-like [Coffea eugenioides]
MNDNDLIFAYSPNLVSANVLFFNSTDIAFSPYGDYWRQLRKICTLELLSSRQIQTFRSIREEEASNMIRSIPSQEGLAVNLSTMISSLAFSIVAQAAYGKRSKYHNEFMSAIKDVTKFMGGFSIVDMYPSIKILEKITGMRHKLQRTHKIADKALENVLNEHRVKRAESKPGNGEAKEDLVGVLLRIQQSGEFSAPLTDNNIKAVIFDVFSGGSESSATTLMWSVAEMINNPEILKRAQDEVREIYADRGNVDES